MKVLIYWDINQLKPTGGPSGYLYNLYNGLDADSNIFFLDSNKSKTSLLKRIKLPQFIIRYLKDLAMRRRVKKILSQVNGSENNPLLGYDIIHFHFTGDLYQCRHLLEKFSGKVILTSHCPKAQHLEIMEDMITKRELRTHKKLYKQLECVDEYAFKRADYLVFPCQWAEEPYLHTWDFYSKNSSGFDKKKRYIPTGIIGATINKTKEDIRNSCGIPSNAFVISYVGRHSQVKGYDTFLKLWEHFKDNPNIYFLVCGAPGDFVYPKSNRWIEIGWTNTPMDYVHASDLFVLPNKETYFDLVLLEVLSIGQLIICSKTGGNKYFERFDNSGIFFYDNLSHLFETTEMVLAMSDEEKNRYQDLNKTIFEKHFTVKKFAKDYLQFYENINPKN